MSRKKDSIIKTLYLEVDQEPYKINIRASTMKRLLKIQEEVRKIDQSTTGQYTETHVTANKKRSVGFTVDSKRIGLGTPQMDGWEDIVEYKDIQKLPEVWFSDMFLYYLRGDSPLEDDEDSRMRFRKVINKKHKELIFWKRLE